MRKSIIIVITLSLGIYIRHCKMCYTILHATSKLWCLECTQKGTTYSA